MDCEKMRELFSEYYDGVLEPGQAETFEAHLKECAECAKDYADFVFLFDKIKIMPQPEIPEDLHRKLMSAVMLDKAKTRAKTKWKPFVFAGGGVAACFILLSLIITGISGITNAAHPHPQAVTLEDGAAAGKALPQAAVLTNEIMAASDSLPEAVPSAVLSEFEDLPDTGVAFDSIFIEPEAAAAPIAAADNQMNGMAKIAAPVTDASVSGDTSQMLAAGFYTQRYSIQITVDDIDAAAEIINSLAGYSLQANVEYSDYGDRGNFNRRVDVENYANVKEILRGLGKVENEYENVVKQSDQITDLEARLKAKDEESERLVDLLGQSRTMEVMVAVEGQLGNVNYNRDDMRGQLNSLYNQATYPYLDIALVERAPEPVPIPEKTFSQKLNETFISSVNSFILFMENAALFFTEAALPILLIAAIALTVWLCVRGKRKKGTNSLLLLLLVIALSGCGSNNGAENYSGAPHATSSPVNAPAPAAEPSAAWDMAESEEGYFAGENAVYDSAPAPRPESSPADNSAAGPIGEKILNTGYISMESDIFDQVIDDMRFSVINAGGFIEKANIYSTGGSSDGTRVCDITLRVPRDRFDEIMEYVQNLAKVTSNSQSAEDVTAQYYDIANRLETRELEEERVLDMISRATKIEDLLALEARLGEIRTDIELFQSQMNNIDRLAAYSTIHVSLYEVRTEEMIVVSDDLGGRLHLALIRSVNNTALFFQNVLLFLTEIFIPLLFVVVLAAVGFAIYKRKTKKAREEREEHRN